MKLTATDQLIAEIENVFDRGGEINPDQRPRYLCITKMYAYLLSSLACYLEDYICKKCANDRENVGKVICHLWLSYFHFYY